jgi:hypothetical protein
MLDHAALAPPGGASDVNTSSTPDEHIASARALRERTTRPDDRWGGSLRRAAWWQRGRSDPWNGLLRGSELQRGRVNVWNVEPFARNVGRTRPGLDVDAGKPRAFPRRALDQLPHSLESRLRLIEGEIDTA